MKRDTTARHNLNVRRFRRRLYRLLFLERALRHLAAAGFLWGALALAARSGLGADLAQLTPWGLVAAGVALVAAGVLAKRNLPPPAAVRTLLDRRGELGGLLMSTDELALGPWSERLAEPVLPRLRWRSGPSLALFAGAAAFVVLATLLPVAPLDAEPRTVAVGEEVEELARRVEVLEEEGLLDEEESERLTEELQNVAESDPGEDPARAWEALDHLRELTEETAAEAAETALTEGEQLAAASAVAEALADESAGDAAAGDPELRLAALAELAALTARAADETRLLDPSLAQQLRDAAASGELERLAEALGASREELAQKLRQLRQAGLLDLEKLLEAQRSLKGQDEALAEFLDENGLEAAGAMCRGRAGRGGVDRGRADAPMIWRDPITGVGVRFEEETLSAASLSSLERSGLIGLSATDPTSAEARPGGGGSGGTVAAGSGAANTQTVLPRHRRAVERFFNRARAPARTDDPPRP